MKSGFSAAQIKKFGKTLAHRAIDPNTRGMIEEMYYSPTHVRPMAYLALADWCEEYGNEEDQKIIAPAREVAKLLTDRNGLKPHGLLVKQTRDNYPITYSLFKNTVVNAPFWREQHLFENTAVNAPFWREQHLLGPKKVFVFGGDRLWCYHILSEGYGPFYDWYEEGARRPFNQSVTFSGTPLILLGKTGGSHRRNSFNNNPSQGDHGEVRIHPLFILWHHLNYPHHMPGDGSASH